MRAGVLIAAVAAFVVAMLLVRPDRGGLATHELLGRAGLERFDLGAVEEGEALVLALLVDGEVRQRLRAVGPAGWAVAFMQPGIDPGGGTRPLDLRLLTPNTTVSSRPLLPEFGAFATERLDAPDPAEEGRTLLLRWAGSRGTEPVEAVLAAWREGA